MSVSGSAPGLYALDPQAPELALALLMLGVLADDHHAAFAADDLALFADGLNLLLVDTLVLIWSAR